MCDRRLLRISFLTVHVHISGFNNSKNDYMYLICCLSNDNERIEIIMNVIKQRNINFNLINHVKLNFYDKNYKNTLVY